MNRSARLLLLVVGTVAVTLPWDRPAAAEGNFVSGHACAEFTNAYYNDWGAENADSGSHYVQCPAVLWGASGAYNVGTATIYLNDGGAYSAVSCEVIGVVNSTSSIYRSGVSSTSVGGTGQTSVTTQALPGGSQDWQGLSVECALSSNNPNDAVLGYWLFDE